MVNEYGACWIDKEIIENGYNKKCIGEEQPLKMKEWIAESKCLLPLRF